MTKKKLKKNKRIKECQSDEEKQEKKDKRAGKKSDRWTTMRPKVGKEEVQMI